MPSRLLLLFQPRQAAGDIVVPPEDSFALLDTFTDDTDTDLIFHDSNWSLSTGNFRIRTNSLYPRANIAECGAAWTGLGTLTDQYAQTTLVSLDAGGLNEVGVGVRVSAVAVTYYGFYVATGYRGLFRRVNGSWDELDTDAVTCNPGDKLRLEVVGTTLTAKVNGAVVFAITDANIASGYPGITGFSTFTNPQDTRIDDFGAGVL